MGELFAFKCKSCGQESNLFYPFLYHDMEHRFWIQIVINPEDDFEYAPNLLPVAYQTMKDYRSRLVSHLNDVKEKILIFEDSLDDRAVEIVKLLLRRNMMETENRVLDGPLRFYDLAKDKQGHPIKLVLGYFPINGDEEIFAADWEYYLDIQEWLYMDLGIPEHEPLGWMRVDENYARQVTDAGKENS